MRKILLASLMASIAVVAHGQSKYLLRINLKPGQVLNYRMDVLSGQMNIGMTMAMKCVKASKKQFTLNSSMGAMTMNGKPMPAQATAQLKNMLVVTVMDDRGAVLSSKMTGVPGMTQSPGNQNATIPLPAKPVGVGDSGSGTADYNGQKIETMYRVMSTKRVGSVNALVVHAQPKGFPQMKLKGPIVMVVDTKTGMPFSMNMSGTVTQGTTSQPMKISMVRK